jgi:hypothetical protein
MRHAWFICLAAALAGSAAAQDAASKPVYRCPGPPVLYTDAVTAQEARDKGCRLIEGAPVTVVQMPRRAAPTASVPRTAEAKVDPAAQRSRDTDSRKILESELRRDEEALAALKKDFNNGEPERRGDERNYAKYLDRVAEMRAAIGRKEADIAALRRELSKLPP